MGAMIGIAIAASAILLGFLAVSMMLCLGAGCKHQKRSRDPYHNDDDNVIEPLGLAVTGAPEIKLGMGTPYEPFQARIEYPLKQWGDENILDGLELADSQFTSLPYSFKIAGKLDSWPLDIDVQSPSPWISLNKFLLTDSANTAERTSCFGDVLSMAKESTWPQRVFARPGSSGRFSDNMSIQRRRHSDNRSVTSLKGLSDNQRSIFDNQLTSKLATTLKESRKAHHCPLSSIKGRVSGPPPAVKVPSPPKASRRKHVDTEDTSSVESVRSSALSMSFTQRSSPKTPTRNAGSLRGRANESSTVVSDISESESLFPPKITDLSIPAVLTSASRYGTSKGQRPRMRISSSEKYPTKIYEDSRGSMVTIGRRDINFRGHNWSRTFPANDPFIPSTISSMSGFKLQPVGSQVTQSQGKLTSKQDSISDRPQNPLFQLRAVSETQQVSIKERPATANMPSNTRLNQFQWSPQSTRSLTSHIRNQST